MTAHPTESDERTLAVENASYRWAYLVLSYGLLVAVGYRGLMLDQASWDLLALVVVAGGVATAVQAQRRVVGRRWLLHAAVVIAVAIAVAAVVAFVAR